MKIVIIGAGEVGAHMSEVLSEHSHDVTVIEENSIRAANIEEEQNVRVICGNGSSAETLRQANVGTCDHFLALTSDDQVNLVASSIAKKMGAANTIARIHEQTYSDHTIFNYQLHFGIDLLLNPEALAAVELAKEIRNPGRVAVENFARGKIEVQLLQVSPGAKAIGRTLMQLKIGSEAGVRIGLVERNKETFIPGRDTLIEEGDILTVFGDPRSLALIRGKFSPTLKLRTLHIVLYGGSETNIVLIRLLANPRFKIRLIEKDETRCQQLAERFPHITVIHGDATSLRVLQEERVGSADYFVAATKADEDNVMTCLQTTKLGTKHTLLHISRADYSEIINQFHLVLGVQLAVSPRVATANEVFRTVNETQWFELAPAPGGTGKILEIRVSAESATIGKQIKDIRLPGQTLIVALLHKYDARVPGANDTIIANDRIVVIVNDEHQTKLLELFT